MTNNFPENHVTAQELLNQFVEQLHAKYVQPNCNSRTSLLSLVLDAVVSCSDSYWPSVTACQSFDCPQPALKLNVSRDQLS